MCRFIETIKIKNAKANNIEYHQKRLEQTIKTFFKSAIPFSLGNLVNRYEFFDDLIYKFRVIYSDRLEDVQVMNYKPLKHKNFKIIELSENIYPFKYENRKILEQFKEHNKENEIIFSLNGKITDTTYSNLAFKKDNIWFIPNEYLLNGTQRQYLLDNNIALLTDINIDNIKDFSSFKLINSLLEFEKSTEYSINQINLNSLQSKMIY